MYLSAGACFFAGVGVGIVCSFIILIVGSLFVNRRSK